MDEQGVIVFDNQAARPTLGCQASGLRGKNLRTGLGLPEETHMALCRAALQEAYEPVTATLSCRGLIRTVRIRKLPGSVAVDESSLFLLEGLEPWEAMDRPLSDAHLLFFQQQGPTKIHFENHRRLTQKMEAIGLLAGRVSHAFNNILSGMIGFTSFLLKRVQQGSAIHRDLSLIEKSAEHAADLTQQLMAFARHKHFTKETVKMDKIITETLKVLSRSLPSDMHIDVCVDESSHYILGDPHQLNQAIMNLCMNAVEAMSDGGGELVVRMESTSLNAGERALLANGSLDPNNFICIRISDSGTGMDEDVLARIFDPFYTTKTMQGSTGLGLSIVYGVITNHGGNILVDSEVGRGSTFRIYLPVYNGDPIPSEEDDENITLHGTETILVVDDELIVRQMVKEVFNEYGYHVIIAASGDEAVQLFGNLAGRVDLVLLDMLMPGMSGETTFHTLRKMDPNLNILLTTGFATEGQCERLLKEGALDVIYKPYKSEALLARLRKIFSSRPASINAKIAKKENER